MRGNDSAEPERLAGNITDRFGMCSAEICAYWMTVSGNREDYARRLRAALADLPIAVLIVRDSGFNNANAVAGDVIRVLESNRTESEAALFRDTMTLHCGVVLLGRAPLAVPQTSSPITLPTWFPVRGGGTAAIVVEDLTWTVDAPLNCPEARIEEICESLYALEGALISRLRSTYGAGHGAGNALMDIIRADNSEKYGALLSEFSSYHAGISVASAFRPSLKEGHSIIGRLWRVAQSRAPEDLHSPSKALATAIALPNELNLASESFAAVLSRPSSRDPSAGRRVARGLISTISSACQFVTAAAHSDEYSRYPIPLLISYSFDVRRSLAQAVRILEDS